MIMAMILIAIDCGPHFQSWSLLPPIMLIIVTNHGLCCHQSWPSSPPTMTIFMFVVVMIITDRGDHCDDRVDCCLCHHRLSSSLPPSIIFVTTDCHFVATEHYLRCHQVLSLSPPSFFCVATEHHLCHHQVFSLSPQIAIFIVVSGGGVHCCWLWSLSPTAMANVCGLGRHIFLCAYLVICFL